MELLLILVLGGLCAWLMRPLRDWYVMEEQDSSGANSRQRAFTRLDKARQAFAQVAQAQALSDAGYGVRLWHVEARSRAHALKLQKSAGPGAVLLEFSGSQLENGPPLE